uniref:Uncharacterized protein n=1 Tax=Setaria viridis TaxID=4556 RepID=A0A4V6Y7X0_SETVI|nr:hypothetical protein SEVIR_8G067900v2 [Setaria viridis]
MADGALRGRSRPKKPRGPLEEMSLNTYVLSQTYLLMAVTGLGFLAFTWATVVLLGGFATALHRKDFWCLTVISMIQRCLKDPTSINGRRVIHYAISLLDSESWEDNLSALRMLDASIHR